ncbi:hypothetical protein Tco_0823702, partial [Tanacetum coccineum]
GRDLGDQLRATHVAVNRLKGTSLDVQEITSSCGKRRADQQLESHVFQMQTQLGGRNVRPRLSANFLHTGNATSVGITQSLHNQSTESVFLHTEGNIVCVRSKERKSRERKVVKDKNEERMRSATLAKSNPKPELLDLNIVLVLHSTFNWSGVGVDTAYPRHGYAVSSLMDTAYWSSE